MRRKEFFSAYPILLHIVSEGARLSCTSASDLSERGMEKTLATAK